MDKKVVVLGGKKTVSVVACALTLGGLTVVAPTEPIVVKNTKIDIPDVFDINYYPKSQSKYHK